MDSLTQMVLGAACGEAVLGKKIGNKALVLGAIGGTIPDLDVLANFVLDQLDALAFHRGPMHSLLFACIFPFIIGFFIKKFYDSGIFNYKAYRIFGFVFSILIFLGIGGVLSAILIFILSTQGYLYVAILVLLGFFFFRYVYKNYLIKSQEFPSANYFDYVKLFFLSIITHPLLDALTTFGTQLFWPFSNHRYAVSNISIVDPIYTFPFLGTVIACGFFDKSDRRRTIINYTGIIISSLYMIGTLYTKSKVETVFKNSLESNSINYSRMLTTPTILNNILWYGIAESDSVYYCGYYSIFDSKKSVDLTPVPKSRDITEPYKETKLIKTLAWFSEYYYNAMPTNGDTIQYNDLRYGTMSFKFDKAEDFIFHFNLLKVDQGINLLPEERPKNNRRDLKTFWERLKGN
jgi:inner membrane protein